MTNTVWIRTGDGVEAEVSIDQARHLIQLGHAEQIPAPKPKHTGKAKAEKTDAKPAAAKS